MAEKIAVVLFNLGGPDSRETIRPFLFNFFMDGNIVRVPFFLRFFIALLISIRRSRREAAASYGEIGGRSPLLENSRAQALALEKALNGAGGGSSFRSFVCMRYWHPMAPQVAAEVREWGADRVVIVPLYPQYSTTTTRSSLQQWRKAMRRTGPELPVSAICCYPLNGGFIEASARHIRACYDRARLDGHAPGGIRILFSAHGLPESVVADGDPYQWQCEQTAEAVMRALGLEAADWQSCYQSRVGPRKWIGPSTEEALEQAAREGKAVIVYPHAFTQEHVETLVELDIEYRHKAGEMGLPGYYRADTAGTDGDFIAGLARLVQDHLGLEGVHAEGMARLCPQEFRRCCMAGI